MGTPHANDQLIRFAHDLRSLLMSAGLSFRRLAALTHYSRTAMSEAVAGRKLPSLAVTLALVSACGGDRSEWERRWHDLHRALPGTVSVAVPAPPVWPAAEVVDGSEPESAGSAADAVTVHARRIALNTRRHIIGQVELRYSANTHAAWGRFEGFSNLDHIATHRHHVVIEVDVVRESDAKAITFREDYAFEYHWTELVRTGTGTYYASAAVYFDDDEVARGETDRLYLT